MEFSEIYDNKEEYYPFVIKKFMINSFYTI